MRPPARERAARAPPVAGPSGDGRLRRAAVALAALAPALAAAHEAAHEPPVSPLAAGEILRTWTLDPWILVPLAAAALLHLRGRARMRAAARAAGAPEPRVIRAEAAAYHGALLAIFVALVSPVDRLSERLFSVHMGQHELLMLVAAPLLALARPLGPLLLGVPHRARAALVATGRRPGFRAGWAFLTAPLVALLLHAAARWAWHLPRLFDAALANRGIHALQHLCFLGTAGLFFWSLVHGRYGRAGYGVAVLAVFATAAHTGLLGAILTLAPAPLYGAYVAQGRALGVDPLDDQALAGLVMWIPAGFLLTLLGLGLFAAWLGEAGRRAARRRA